MIAFVLADVGSKRRSRRLQLRGLLLSSRYQCVFPSPLNFKLYIFNRASSVPLERGWRSIIAGIITMILILYTFFCKNNFVRTSSLKLRTYANCQLFLIFSSKPQKWTCNLKINAKAGFTTLFLLSYNAAIEHKIIAGDNIFPMT